MEITTQDIEIALANHFNTRINLIVPNVAWGLHFKHEIDLLVVTPSKYAFEIEVKVSKSDLKRDLLKRHGHESNRIKRFYFAVPKKLESDALALIPERAGLFTVNDDGFVTLVKAPKVNTTAVTLKPHEMQHLYELVSMRIWNLKEKIRLLQKH